MPHQPNSDDILAALDPEQREVAARPLGPMCVLAGAGTGKTRAITHRIAYGVHSGAYEAQRVLAVTFTSRAAGEMRTRLRGLGVPGVQARTFHGAALRQLQYFWPKGIGGQAPELLTTKAPAVREAGRRLRLNLDGPAIRDLASEIEWAKVSMLTAETYADYARRIDREPPGLDRTAMARLIATYDDVKSDRGVIDFEDVLLVMAGLLADRDDIARAVRSQYRHFVVDEYQDVNALQQYLLDLWVGERSDVCVVGDPAQTIYSFTGATPKHLVEFPQRHKDAQTVRLVRNYRSTPQVVQVANLVLSGAKGASGALPGRVELQAQREAGPTPDITSYADDEAEARWVATAIKRLIDQGREPADIAVLFRVNAQSEAFESALARADVPYIVRGGERFFARPEVRKAILLLRGAVHAEDTSMPLPEMAGEVLTGDGWTATPPSSGGAARDKWESQRAIISLAEDLVAAVPDARMPQLVAELDRRANEQHAPTVQGVTLASLHAAKGLEWGVVFLAGCSDGLMPISLAEGAEAIEEERRLLYVGLTRARDELHLSYALARNPGGRAGRKPSRFLAPARSVLGSAAVAADGGNAGSRRKKSAAPKAVHCRSCNVVVTTAAERKVGRCSDCPPTYDEALFERLKDWRKAVSSQAKVPAYVVFTDATLTAIAESEPSDVAGLSRISGVGQRKLDLYGEDVLRLLSGEPVADVLGADAGAAE